jgi:hypothetical protein
MIVLVYALLGTMPHVSMGTFAVISIMVFAPVSQFSTSIITAEEGVSFF